MWTHRSTILLYEKPMVSHTKTFTSKGNTQGEVCLNAFKKWNCFWDINQNLFILSAFKIREHGLQARETKRIYDSKPQCDSSGSSFGSVRIQDCYAVLLIFLYGLIACILIVFCEMLWNSKEKFLNILTNWKHSIWKEKHKQLLFKIWSFTLNNTNLLYTMHNCTLNNFIVQTQNFS